MASVARQLWLFVAPLLAGLSAAGLLVLASFFPVQLFSVGSDGYIATAVVAVVALATLVWRLATTDSGFVGGLDGPEREL